MNNTIILYGSTTGNTENMAKLIAKKIDADVFNVDNFNVKQLDDYKNLILGTSTWGIGDLQDDWDSFISPLSKATLEGKTVAIFGLGDSMSYSDSFADAMRTIYDALQNKDIHFVGYTNADDYDFTESQAVVDGQFIGLPLDEDNEGEKSEKRIDNWLKSFQQDLQ